MKEILIYNFLLKNITILSLQDLLSFDWNYDKHVI